MRIDIWSDIACPWCYIGLTRFKRVLAESPHTDDIEVRLRSFQLDPLLPTTYDGSETEYLATRKGMPEDQVRKMFGQVEQVAASEGLAMDFDSVRVANSWRAHRLLQAASAADPSGNMTIDLEQYLFRAHFHDGRVISDPAVLMEAAAAVGLDAEAAREAAGEESPSSRPGGRIDNDLDRSVVKDLREAQELGIQGVPFFVLAGKYGISGAQPAEVFESAIQQVWDELHPKPEPLVPFAPVGAVAADDASGPACGPEGCD